MFIPYPTAAGGDGAAPPGATAAPLVGIISPTGFTPGAPGAAGATALDVWHAILGAHLAARPSALTPTGEAYPETTLGDVRRAALVFSRELCQPRYDLANLTDTRAAWRDALARVQGTAAIVPWDAPYPSNPQFWLGDTRALAQRLAAVDVRRNRLVNARPDGLAQAVGAGDPLTTYLDVRAYFLARRLTRTDERAWRYPETTVGDVVQIVRIVDGEIARVVGTSRSPEVREFLLSHLPRWRAAAASVPAAARTQPHDAPYVDNANLWRAYRRVSIPLAVARDATNSESRNPFTAPVLP